MSEVLLPTWIIPEEESHEWLDEGSSVFAAAFAPGIAQRQSFGGLRLKLSRRHTVRGEEKAQLLSILQSTRGRYNALRTKVHFALRGSGFGSELLSNNTFANGTTGWGGSNSVRSVQDREMRLQPVALGSQWQLSQPVALTQYAPYVLRSFIKDGPSTSALSIGRALFTESGVSVTDYSASRGMGALAAVVSSASSIDQFPIVVNTTSGYTSSEFISIPYTSLSRCAQIDNGPNLLLRSDEIDNVAWTKTGATVPSVVVAPDGTATADFLREDSSTGQHFAIQNVTVPSSAADYAFSVAVRSNGRDFVRFAVTEGTGSTVISQYFNLSGAVGSTGTTGSNWSNRRAFISDLGNGWYKCTLVGRKTNAATSLAATVIIASADGTDSYTGNSTGGVAVWRATLAQSSVPTRLIQTTTTASTGTSQTGNALYVKGLPASTNGLLLPGDWFEINGELKQCTAALNSDAAQLGYLQFEPALVRSPSNDDPINITDPMGKFLVSNIKIDNDFGTQARVSYDLEHIYE